MLKNLLFFVPVQLIIYLDNCKNPKYFYSFFFFFIKKEKQEEELVLNYRDRKVAKNWREFFYFSLFNYQGGKKYK